MKHRKYSVIFILAFTVLFFYSCQQPEGNVTGSEYMPDMGHSIAYEANVYNYYYHNTWDEESDMSLKELSLPRYPVKGTIARGYAGIANASGHASSDAVMNNLQGEGQAIRVPINGNVPYYYADTEEERTRATNEIINNPFPITAAGLEQGKELYIVYCGICHGDKGDGAGYLVRDDGGKYPAQPALFTTDDFITASNGRFYHAIMYGKNVMGSHADKLSYEERWQVIHYIRSLQAKAKKLEYNENVNTLNSVDVPGIVMSQLATHKDGAVDGAEEMHKEHHGTESHGVEHAPEEHKAADDHNGHDH